MIAFKVRDMFSRHSAGAIIESVKAVNSDATVHVDLMTHSAEIEPAWPPAPEPSDAMDKAGFTATALGSVYPKIRRSPGRISFERPGEESLERRSVQRNGQ